MIAALSPVAPFSLLSGKPAGAATTPTVLLHEGFESGAPGWQFSGFWHVQDHPENISVSSGINPGLVTLPDAGGLPPAFAGTHAAWFGEPSTGTFCGQDYATIQQTPKDGCTSTGPFTGRLMSPPFDLTSASTAEVDFSSWWEIESVNADHFDVMSVQFSTDGGSTWVPVASLNPTSNPAGLHDQSYAADGLEEPPAWHHYIADLSAAAGHANVMLGFSFATNDQLFNGFRGWLLDEVTVSAPFAKPPPAITSLDQPCVSPGTTSVVSAYGSNFVLGSRVLVDGTTVTGATPSDERIEFVAPLASGLHTVQVVSPNGTSSNSVSITAADSCPPAPTRYVALGDSYSSGEGVPPFASGTDTGSDTCHRSNSAYAPLLVQQHPGGAIPATAEFWACSGAVISDFYSNNHSSGEPAQLGRLDPGNATLVTLSVGGNDIGFAHIGATCLKVNATTFDQLNHDFKENCRNVLNTDTMSKIQNLGLRSLYTDIRRKAPHADVYVMGYPRVLPSNPTSDCQAQAYREDGRKATVNPFDQKATDGFIGVETRISKDDVIWMNKVIDRLNGKISAEAAYAGFHFVDVTDAFSGHDLCSNNTDPSNRPWAHGLVLASNSNDSPPNPSAFSFHPNADGQAAMEDRLFQSISGGSHITIHPGETQTLPVLVGIGQALLNIITHWPGSDVVTTLISPSGKTFDRSTPGIAHFVTATSENYAINDPEPGTWTVQLYGANVHQQGEDVRVDSTTVPSAAMAPVAVAAATPDRGVAPVPVTFDGSGSMGVSAPVSSYTWNFGDGSAPANGASVSHVYATGGTYVATLTVTDTAGRSDTTQKTIVVSTTDQAPTADLSLNTDPKNTGQVFYDASNSYDVDGSVVSYSWDFGDGSHSTQPFGFHKYLASGTYTVRLTVTDDGGLMTTAEQTLNVTAAQGPAVDKVVSAHQGRGRSRVTTPPVTTTSGDELVLAFVSADGPSGRSQRVSSVTGGGLSWSLATRANDTPGDAEVWQAHAASPLSGVTVTARLAKKGFDATITVATFSGAAPTVGAAAGSGASGVPEVSLTTTKAGSLVWGVGHDWAESVARTPDPGQVVVDQFLDIKADDTFWVQRTTAIPTAATPLTFGDSQPTTDPWNLAAVEIRSR